MNKSPFNHITHQLAAGMSRRTALKGLGGTVSAGLVSREQAAGSGDQGAAHIDAVSTSQGIRGTEAITQKQGLINAAEFVDASRFGAVGDGKTGSSAALQAAIDEAGATKRPLWIPAGTYLIDVGLSGVDDLTVFGYGATLTLTAAGDHTPVLSLSKVNNIRLFGLTVDGNRDAFAVKTEWKHALELLAAHDVTIEDCLLTNAKGDGLYIGPLVSDPSSPSEDIMVRGVRMVGNYRQGCSIIGARRAQFVVCRFTGTGGTPPQCGVDIEPDSDEDVIEHLAFWMCELSGNAGAGAKVSLSKDPVAFQDGIDFIGCNMGNNNGAGVELSVAYGAGFHASNIFANGTNGVEFGRDNQKSITFIGGTISGNAQHGMKLSVGNSTVTGFKAVGVTIKDNGARTDETYDGIHISEGTFTDILIDGCTITGHSQQYGIHTLPGDTNTEINDLRIVNNDLTGNGIGGARLAIETETQHVANNFGDIE